MRSKTYFVVCGAIFLIIAAAHLTRLLMGWDVAIAGWAAPGWISVIGFVVPGLMSAWGFRLASRTPTSAT